MTQCTWWVEEPTSGGTYRSPCLPPLLGLTRTRSGWVPGRGVTWRQGTTESTNRKEAGSVPGDGQASTCSACPSPGENLNVWLVSSGLVLGGDSPSPRFTTEWRSWDRRKMEGLVFNITHIERPGHIWRTHEVREWGFDLVLNKYNWKEPETVLQENFYWATAPPAATLDKFWWAPCSSSVCLTLTLTHWMLDITHDPLLPEPEVLHQTLFRILHVLKVSCWILEINSGL